MISQLPKGIMMVRPYGFGANPETAPSNTFQEAVSGTSEDVAIKARREFDLLIQKLESHNIPVYVFEEEEGMFTPDAVFPNNWISFHPDGTVVIYPMESASRRKERRFDILDQLQSSYNFEITRVIDLSCYERNGYYLESTGSLIFDYPNQTAYVCRSSRSSEQIIAHLAQLLGLKIVLFDSFDKQGLPIYHTNVMMCLAEKFAVLCLESIPEGPEKEVLLESLKRSKRELVDLTLAQVYAFAGNMYQLKNRQGQKYLLMSDTAYQSMDPRQIEQIESHCAILSSPIPTIQKYGGGSIRCMMAGVMLPAAL